MKSIQKTIEELRPWTYTYTHNEITITNDISSVDHADVPQSNVTEARRALAQDYRTDILINILNVIQTRLPEFNSLRILDMGCAEGFYSDILCSLGFQEVVSVELSEKHAARASFLLKEFKGYSNSTVIQGNVLDYELMMSLGQFDLILFHGLLYHLHSPVMAFKIIEKLIRDKNRFFLLLSHSYVMDYNLMVHAKALAEVHVRSQDWPRDEDRGVTYDPRNESAYDQVATIVNGKALYKILRAFGYTEIVTYDSPLAQPGQYVSRFVLSKNNDENLLSDLNARSSKHSGESPYFYYWAGSSADSYSFRARVKSVLARLSYQFLDRVTKLLTFFRL